MIAEALRQSGYRVGLFTSPHVCTFAERIRLDGESIDTQTLIDVISRAVDIGPELTFFETTFLASLLCFAEARVDVAVLEVGLGGRLDATNIVETPLVTAITRIAFDHVDKLGTTLVEIGLEKAGIAKKSSPMVLGPLETEVRRAICHHARGQNCGAIDAIDVELQLDRQAATLVDPQAARAIELRPSLPGAYQIENAAVAAAVCVRAAKHLPKLTLDTVERGIASAKWPARLELIETPAGRVLIDAAHNPDGINSLAQYLRSFFDSGAGTPSTTALVYGSVADKNWRGMLPRLSPHCAKRFFVEPGGRAAAPTATMAQEFNGHACESVEAGLSLARQSVGNEGLIVVAGSIFLAGAARSIVLGVERDPAVGL
jgi:dihydrofolate synthase/folylpolyglutamate synthase